MPKKVASSEPKYKLSSNTPLSLFIVVVVIVVLHLCSKRPWDDNDRKSSCNLEWRRLHVLSYFWVCELVSCGSPSLERATQEQSVKSRSQNHPGSLRTCVLSSHTKPFKEMLLYIYTFFLFFIYLLLIFFFFFFIFVSPVSLWFFICDIRQCFREHSCPESLVLCGQDRWRSNVLEFRGRRAGGGLWDYTHTQTHAHTYQIFIYYDIVLISLLILFILYIYLNIYILLYFSFIIF